MKVLIYYHNGKDFTFYCEDERGNTKTKRFINAPKRNEHFYVEKIERKCKSYESDYISKI
jgi:hypothetical protein